IDPTLGLDPFAEETSLAKFVIGHKLWNGRDLLDVAEGQRRHRIEPPVRFCIESQVVRIDADMVIGVAGFADRVLREQAASLAFNEIGDLCKDAGPPRRVEHRVVDVLSEFRKGEILLHRISHKEAREYLALSKLAEDIYDTVLD